MAQRLEARVIYRLLYYSALDNALRQRGIELHPQTSDLIAPTDWCTSQVQQAWLKHHPGASLVSCKPLPKSIAA